MAAPFNFGIYHWRRRGRRLVESAALVGVGSALYAVARGRIPRLVALSLAAVGLVRGSRTVGTLLSPPPWVLRREKYDALARELPLSEADRILDVGCGTGRSLVGLAPHVPDHDHDHASVVGLDVFDARVILGNAPALARRNASRAGLDVAVVAGDATRLPITSGSQDVVTVCRVLHDLPGADSARALREIRRVCRPHGTLGVLELSRTHGVDADPLEYWRDRLVEAGFTPSHAARLLDDGEETGYVVIVAKPA